MTLLELDSPVPRRRTGEPRMQEVICGIRFSKSDLGPFGMLKQVFLARFEREVTRFGPWKIPKCLQNGPFWD